MLVRHGRNNGRILAPLNLLGNAVGRLLVFFWTRPWALALKVTLNFFSSKLPMTLVVFTVTTLRPRCVSNR